MAEARSRGLRAFTKYETVEYANGEEVPAQKFLAEVEGVVLDTMLGKLSGVVGGNVSAVGNALRTMSFLPFLPPNVGGYPKGARLLGPHSLVHTFDLLQAVASPSSERESVGDLFARFGIHDVSDQSRSVVARERDKATRLALVVTSPEYALV